MRITIGQDTKYFCITEAVALYLQNSIHYRKRKVFYGADGTNKSMFDVVNKHKENEKFFMYAARTNRIMTLLDGLKQTICEFQLCLYVSLCKATM